MPAVVFNSLEYAAFLPAVAIAYWRMGHRPRLWLLLAASYVFYGSWDWRFLSLIIVSTVVDFLVARGIEASDDDRRRKRLLLVSLGVNLGILGFFKYFGFFVDSAEELLAGMGLGVSGPTLEILLPVGISFYTFQTLSYTLDVYRRRLEPTRDWLVFAVFVAFFPQLVAGPIERARHLLPQFQTPRPALMRDDVTSALHLIGLGLVKKVVVADGLAPHVNEAFATSGEAGWVTLLVGMIGFSLQIYGDFSGYSDIARGSARLLGIDVMQNFTQPYLSRDIGEFWRRWHVSLSTWLRDYLYIPLGGNRGTRLLTYRNLFLTMLLGGLWHGAAWTFVVWGAIHGILLGLNRLRGKRVDEAVPVTWADLPAVVWTWMLAAGAFVVFRAASMSQATEVLGGILTLRAGPVLQDGVAALVVLGGLMVAIDLVQRVMGDEVAVLRWPTIPRSFAHGMAAVGLIVFSGGAPVPFIYFQF